MLRRQVDMERQQWLRGTLYSPAFEQDSCGFGLIAQLDDQPSHWLVSTAISSLAQLTHRGAVAADGKSGDGCGLLFRKPDGFLREAVKAFHAGMRQPGWKKAAVSGSRIHAADWG